MLQAMRAMPQLHAITTVWNPARYQSRYRLYRNFADHVESSGAALYTVELATGDQDFVVTDAAHPRHIQLRTSHELWFKENLVNIAIGRLPRDCEYVAWLDADIQLMRPDWVARTIAGLERHAVVQMFSHVIDLGPDFEALKIQNGFAYLALTGGASGAALPGQTGYAWAARRRELEAVGGLIDWSILGSNDYFMALGLVGGISDASTRQPGSNYAAMLLDWQAKCERHVGRDIGYVANSIAHYWHGNRKDRGYNDRWKILVGNDFDPQLDLTRSDNGLLELSGRKPGLRDGIRDYFRSRNEDSTRL